MQVDVGRGAECYAEESFSLRNGAVAVAEDIPITFFSRSDEIVGHQAFVLCTFIWSPRGGPLLLIYS